MCEVIGSDKTGPLTANAMTAREVVTAEGHYQVSGEGYQPSGVIHDAQHQPVTLEQDRVFAQACEVAMLCNDANVVEENSQWVLHGDPTEWALLVLAKKIGLQATHLKAAWPVKDMLPFISEKR